MTASADNSLLKPRTVGLGLLDLVLYPARSVIRSRDPYLLATSRDTSILN
jgi:hypothetical protein